MRQYEPIDRIAASLARLHGRVEAQIEATAAALGVPSGELTSWLGAVLSSPPSGPVLGSLDRVSYLRSPAAQIDRAPRPLALDGSTHREAARSDGRPKGKLRHITPEGRAAISTAMKQRWAKTKAKAKAKAKAKTKKNPKQAIYIARHAAKKAGLPLPPLPQSA